jgi:hypothetical protein
MGLATSPAAPGSASVPKNARASTTDNPETSAMVRSATVTASTSGL